MSSVITSTNYWETIFTELQDAIEENSHVKYLYIAKKYDQAIMAVEDRIRFFYGKNATDNKIPLRQAYKKLPPEQLDMFHDLIATYLRDWREELGYDLGEKPVDHAEKVSGEDTSDEGVSDVDTLNDTETWLNVLQEYETKSEVTEYEALVIPILNEVEKTSHELGKILLVLTLITGWEVYRSITENLNLEAKLFLSQDALRQELLKSWASDNLSLYERLSVNKSKLSAAVKTALLKGFRNEATVDEVVDEVSRVMGVGSVAARKLVVTENTHFNNYSTYLALKQAGYKTYKIVARIDGKTCDDCIDWNGDVYPIDQYEPNVTAPPKHSHCRCYIIKGD